MSSHLPAQPFATLMTQILVAADAAAFSRPTKPIGPSYRADDAQRLAAAHGRVADPHGKGWRRVVASPKPLEVLERRVIRVLADQGVTVICSGGGIPVVWRSDGSLAGVEAVIDKDFASALLASQPAADMLLLLTDVDAVNKDFGTSAQRANRGLIRMAQI